MDGVRPGICMLWSPATRGLSATVTVISVDLDRDKALVHVFKRSTGTCAPHWVDLERLSEAPKGTHPCLCASALAPKTPGHDAA
jgi:hypothetical protein